MQLRLLLGVSPERQQELADSALRATSIDSHRYLS
jgi:hypothetical protein